MNTIQPLDASNWVQQDKDYVWHPYSAMHSDLPVFPVASANGVRLQLKNGKELIDGMSSWWCAVHGYNHPVLNKAISDQLQKMSHVMFGGLTHEPAARLAEKLVSITPQPLQNVFFSDSGSVSVEVAMKIAIQYWAALDMPKKQRFLTIRSGYHGDTFGAMSVCDPVTGMHSLFAETLTPQFFIESPQCKFDEPCDDELMSPLLLTLEQHHEKIAAVILEPIVQGAGGMKFYSPQYLAKVKIHCEQFGVLLIADEIATGFGRSGKLFACEHAAISPDIMCVGKALTGGYMTLAATLTTEGVSKVICSHPPGVFMHGPTFMANPLACSVANASIDLLLGSEWLENIQRLEKGLLDGLKHCEDFSHVHEVRVLGAIGVVELTHPVDMKTIQPAFVVQGVWVRPFGKLVYLMPPYIISNDDLQALTSAVVRVVSSLDM